MTANDRIKRRLLRELVQENVATARGEPPQRLRRRRPWLRWAVAGLGAALPAGLLVLASATGTPRWLGGPVPAPAPSPNVSGITPASSPAASPSAAPLEVMARLDPGARFPHPAHIDPRVLPLGVRTVVLDPGHGGEDRGTKGPGGLIEKELTYDIASRVGALLADAGYRVAYTREHDDAVALDRRAALANETRGDVLVSIHVNWIPNRRSRGIETYYLGATDDPYINDLAASENRNSGYSLADFRRLLEGIYADVRQEQSRALAQAVQTELYRSLAAVNPALRDWGVKTAPFIVLVATEMPAILAEVACLSNDAEAHLLATPTYRDTIARALFAGIDAYTRSRAAATEKGS